MVQEQTVGLTATWYVRNLHFDVDMQMNSYLVTLSHTQFITGLLTYQFDIEIFIQIVFLKV
jgi:hypothetical protein